MSPGFGGTGLRATSRSLPVGRQAAARSPGPRRPGPGPCSQPLRGPCPRRGLGMRRGRQPGCRRARRSPTRSRTVSGHWQPPPGPGPRGRAESKGGASFKVCCRHRRQRATMLLCHRDEGKLAAVSWSHAHPSRVVWTLQWHLHALSRCLYGTMHTSGCCALRCLEGLAPHSTSAMARAAANLGWMRLCTSRNRSIF